MILHVPGNCCHLAEMSLGLSVVHLTSISVISLAGYHAALLFDLMFEYKSPLLDNFATFTSLTPSIAYAHKSKMAQKFNGCLASVSRVQWVTSVMCTCSPNQLMYDAIVLKAGCLLGSFLDLPSYACKVYLLCQTIMQQSACRLNVYRQ